jgi:outer membrane receptor protein involved in Fe transport
VYPGFNLQINNFYRAKVSIGLIVAHKSSTKTLYIQYLVNFAPVKKVLFLFVLLSVVLPITSKAQGDPNNTPSGFLFEGTISGSVIDSISKQPIEYAAVSVIAMKDSSIAGGMVTDETGKFKIEKLKPGRYTLRIKYIGYTEKRITGIVLSQAEPAKEFNQVAISQATQNLKEVEITHYTEVMEANLDKRVINVEKDLTSVGGTALDVMKNVPSVQVDVDNTISLRGNSSVRILIDGRLTTMDAATLLQQIPASMVKQVEVITNPSAKYDPDGVSGIINIITKKERKPGYNAIFNAGATTGSTKPGGGMENFTVNKYNFNTSMNYQVGKFNFFGSYDGRYGMRWNQGKTYRELYDGDSIYDILHQYNGRMRPTWNNTAKLGTDIALSQKDLMTVNGNLRTEKVDARDSIDYSESNGNDAFIRHYTRNNHEQSKELGYDAGLNYKHKFNNEGHEIVFDGMYSHTAQNKLTTINESYFDQVGDVYAQDSVHEEITEKFNRQVITAQLDYVNPTPKNGRFEAGLKYMGRINNQSIDVLSNAGLGYLYNDANRTNGFDYNDHIMSAYGIYANSFKKFKYQAGLRFEQALTHSYQVTLDKTFERDFYNFFPSAHLKYALSEGSEISFSYSRRINRPGNNQLNPYPNYADKLSYQMGNPYLRPEYISSFELSYGKFAKGASFTATLFYRHTVNNFFRFKTVDPVTGISITSFANISQSHSAGVELTWNQTINKWMRVNANSSVFYYYLQPDAVYGTPANENISYTARGTINLIPAKDFDFQITGNYRGPMVAPQGTVKPMWNLDLGLKKDFWNKKASLQLKVSDIFNTQRFRINAAYANYYSEIYHKWESRNGTLTFTYKINQFSEKREKPRDMGNGGDTGM